MLDLLLNDGNTTLVGVLVFLAAGTLAFSIMAVARVQSSVKRRAANIGRVGDIEGSGGNRSLRHSSKKAAQRVIEYTAKHYASGNADDTKVLRRRMIQAGLYHPHAVAYFFLGRTALAVGMAMLLFLFAPVQPADRYSGCWSDWAASPATSGPAFISTSASGPEGRASVRVSGFHGPAGGVRRCGSQHGGIARPRRPRIERFVSLAHRQPAHDQSRNPRRPHHERSARASRRPARYR